MFSLKKSFLKNTDAFLFCLASIFSICFILKDNGVRYSFVLLLLLALVAISSLYGIFLSIDKAPYSINKTYHVFTYFFFSIAPAMQFKMKISLLEAPLLSKSQFLNSAILILVIQIVYLMLYNYFYANGKLLIESKDTIIINFKLIVVLSVVSLVAFLYLVDLNPDVIFKRPPNHWQKYNTKHGLIGYSLLLIVRSIPVICLIIFELTKKVNKLLLQRVALLLIVLLISFPTSLSRATLAYYYLPLLIIYYPGFKKPYYYVSSFFLGVFFLFPALNYLRPNGFSDFGFKQFLSPHFDAFHNLTFLVTENTVTYGNQLLGAILFFVPKNIWSTKPVGTGQMIAEKLDFIYTNVSMPLWGEGFANFGYLGVFSFLLMIVFLNAFLDKNYILGNLSLAVKVGYLFLLGFEFYLLRGDLYSSIKLSGSYFLALFFVIYLIKTEKKIIKKN